MPQAPVQQLKSPMERPRPSTVIQFSRETFRNGTLVPHASPDPDFAILRAKKRRRRKPLAPIDDTSYGEIQTTPLTAQYGDQGCSSGEKGENET